jgi:hypothetical protein
VRLAEECVCAFAAELRKPEGVDSLRMAGPEARSWGSSYLSRSTSQRRLKVGKAFIMTGLLGKLMASNDSPSLGH